MYPTLTISDYQAQLPYDFHNLIQIGYSTSIGGAYYPMRYGTGSMDAGSEATPSSEEYDVVPETALITLTMELYDLSYADAVVYLNANPDKSSQLTFLLRTEKTSISGGTATTSDLTYIINDSYIRTNQKTGYLILAYQAIPTDAEGYPMIPDDISYREAIYWYINMKLLYVDWKVGRVRDAVYYDARRSWNYYCKQAYGNAMMPNADQMESIKNTWIRMIPELDEHDTFFSTLGQQQVIYNQNYSSK